MSQPWIPWLESLQPWKPQTSHQKNPVYILISYLFKILSFHHPRGLPSGIFPSSFPTIILKWFLSSPMHTKSVHVKIHTVYHQLDIKTVLLVIIFFFFQLASTVLIRPWPSLMDFSIHRYLVGLLGWGISPMQGLYLHTGQHNTETRRHTSMLRAGFEPAISMFKRS